MYHRLKGIKTAKAAYTGKDIEGMVRTKILTDRAWTERAVKRLFELQTDRERSERRSIDDNGIGFNKLDATILSFWARMSWGSVPSAELRKVSTVASKYARQLASFADRQKLARCLDRFYLS